MTKYFSKTTLALIGVLIASFVYLNVTAPKTVGSTESVVSATTASVPVVSAFTATGTTATSLQFNTGVTVEKKKIKQLFLNESNTILLTGIIAENAPNVAQQINEMAQHGKPIYLVINSPGGSVLDGMAVINAIQASPVPVNTVCLQICASMAAIIHEYGTHRYMADRSLLMFHEAAGGFQGYFNQIKSRLMVFDRLTQKLDFEIAKRVGQDPETFKSKLANEIWVDAEDAVKQNYADGIVNVNLQLPANDMTAEKGNLSQTNLLKDQFYIYAF